MVDARIIDGAVNGAANLVRSTGSVTRKLQTGYVRNYALGIALGMAALIVFLLSRTWWSMSHSVPFLTLLILLPAVGGVALASAGPGSRLPKELGRLPWPSGSRWPPWSSP